MLASESPSVVAARHVRPAAAGLAVLVGTLLAGCGQKGPLTLPAAPATAAQPASAPAR